VKEQKQRSSCKEAAAKKKSRENQFLCTKKNEIY
jgi:hypothetical protein